MFLLLIYFGSSMHAKYCTKGCKNRLKFVIYQITQLCPRAALDIIFLINLISEIQAIIEYHYVLQMKYWSLDIYFQSGHLIFMHPSRKKVSHVVFYLSLLIIVIHFGSIIYLSISWL